MLAILAASPVVDVCSVLSFSEVWWVGRKSSRLSAARVDREGSLALPSWLAEAWLVKESTAILLASVLHACRIPLRLRISMHVELHWVTNRLHVLDALRMTAERAIAALLLSPPSVIALRPIRTGKLPSSLICAGYMYCRIVWERQASHTKLLACQGYMYRGVWDSMCIFSQFS